MTGYRVGSIPCKTKKQMTEYRVGSIPCKTKKQMTGIEPAYSAWEADVLPLNYICMCMDAGNRGRTCTVSRRILNPVRLPIPPYPHLVYPQEK